jgi:hypothetical protein
VSIFHLSYPLPRKQKEKIVKHVNAFVDSKLQISADDLINLEKAINEDTSPSVPTAEPQSDQVLPPLLLLSHLTSLRAHQQNFLLIIFSSVHHQPPQHQENLPKDLANVDAIIAVITRNASHQSHLAQNGMLLKSINQSKILIK